MRNLVRNLFNTILFVSVDSFRGPTYWVLLLICSLNVLEMTNMPLEPGILQPWCLIEVIMRCINAGRIKNDGLPLLPALWGRWLMASAQWSHWLSAIRDCFHLCHPTKCGWPFKRGWGIEKRTKRKKNADWLAAESRGIVHELSANLCCYVIFDERGECEELSRATEGLQCHCVAVKPATPHLFCSNFINSMTPQWSCHPLVQQWLRGHIWLQSLQKELQESQLRLKEQSDNY